LRELKDELAIEKQRGGAEDPESLLTLNKDQSEDSSSSALQSLVKSGDLPFFQQVAAQAMDELCLQILRETIGSM